jgi:hypothetical protein
MEIKVGSPEYLSKTENYLNPLLEHYSSFFNTQEDIPVTFETDIQATKISSSILVRNRTTPVVYTLPNLLPRLG